MRPTDKRLTAAYGRRQDENYGWASDPASIEARAWRMPVAETDRFACATRAADPASDKTPSVVTLGAGCSAAQERLWLIRIILGVSVIPRARPGPLQLGA